MFKKLLLASTAIVFTTEQANSGPIPVPYTAPYVSVVNRAPTSSDDGSSGTPCAAGMTWYYSGNAWQQQVCGVSGAHQAHWQLMPNPGLPLDAVAALGNTTGHAWGTFKATSTYSGNALTLSNLAGTPQTVNIGFVGNLADYTSMDNFLTQYPESYTVIPDSFNGIYVPQEVTATTVYDQTNTALNTAYNLVAPTGLFTATATGGTGYTNSTVAVLTTTGCPTVVDAPQIATTAASGVPNPVALATTNASQFAHPGECVGGTFQAAQTEASHTGTETVVASAWTVASYNEGPIWQFLPANKMGIFRGLNFNSIQSQLGVNQLTYLKTLVNTTLPWTPSSATVITVMRLADGLMQATIYGSLDDGQVVSNTGVNVANAAAVAFSNAKGSCKLAVSSTPTALVVTWNSGGSTKLDCRDGNTFNQGYTGGTSASAATGFEIGGTTSSNSMKATWVGTLLWTTPLTTAQENAALLSIVLLGQLPLQYDKILDFGGGSNYTSGPIDGFNSITSVIDNLTTPAKVYNLGVHGEIACGGASASFTTENQYVYDPTVRKFVFVEVVGTNDISAGATAATVEPCQQSVVQQGRAFYPGSGANNISFLWDLGPLQCSTLTSGGSYLTNMLALGSYDLANASYASGGLGADSVANMLNDPVLTGGTYTAPGGNISVTASAYCSIPASATASYPNANSPEGGHQYKPFTDQWVPLWTAVNAQIAN